MQLLYTHRNDALRRALRAAVASHRPAALRALLNSQGNQAFAWALSDLSGRVIADALSMLVAADRAAVLCHLPRAARNRLREAEGLHAHAPLYARSVAPASSLFPRW
ncbi:hypothetical protein ACDH70_00190 [Xanthomonas axonopodis pv. poinsettiicola]|uniref:hypothetical protein n=1 Tax=Xanthomonas TaxID=338 RepID=UPI001E49D33E|nr:hypothetical protein [Xanthomonas codiaei]MCC8535810.1 hypothetical protein [Xanthomonas codiaei]